jgi:polar amino acid transport system substrate-binding protein
MKILILMLLVLPLTAHAATADEVRKELAPTGTLRAAINYNNPVLARRDPTSGELRGLAVDLSRELARRLGVPLALVPYDAAGKITDSAKDDVWDVGYLAIDPLRANEITFTPPHVELEGTYLVPAGSRLQRIADIDREGVRIAVTANSAYDLFLTRTLKHAQLVRANSTPESFELMRVQRLDGVAAVKTALVAQAKQLPGARVLSGHFMTIPQAAAVPKGRPHAAHYVSNFIEEMKASGFVAAALQTHGFGPDDAIVAPPAFKILATLAAQGAIRDIEPLLSERAGVPMSIEFGQTAALLDRLLAGEPAPLVILTKPAVQQLAAKGKVVSQTDLAASLVGIAVADDAPVPRLENTADFVAFLKATPSIAYPARGASGIHLTQLIEKLGLAEVMRPKVTLLSDGTTATLLRERKVAAAVQQISELKMAGAKTIVPLPDEIQLRSIITAAVLEGGFAGDTAARIVSALTSPEAFAAYERSALSAPVR